MSDKKIKVVWLCHFSNEEVHNHLDLGEGCLKRVIRKIIRKPLNTKVSDFAVWITNGIKEMELFNEVELHVVSPYPYLRESIQEFIINGVSYHFYKNQEELLCARLFKIKGKAKKKEYRKNRKVVSNIICNIQPDIVHLFGAENPYYSLSLLDVSKTIPTIVQLQTLLSDPDFKNNYPINDVSYRMKSTIEQQIIKSATYIGTKATKYRKIIHDTIASDAIILNTTLALEEPLYIEKCDKLYDFVYFAANINKAADLALEAFGRAHQKNPTITLDIIGSYDVNYKTQLDDIIKQFEISDAVVFEGKLLTHDDVLCQIRKSCYALLPLRIDLISGTIREAMSNGLPVVTTDTGKLGTQKLNNKRQNVLISPIGDHQALADNMLRLLYDEQLADTLRQNAFQTRSEVKSNAMVIQKYVEAYKACIDNFNNGTPIPESLTKIN